MASGIPSLIPATEHLHLSLTEVLKASVAYSSSDPGQRAAGESTFLDLRRSDASVELGCFFLGEWVPKGESTRSGSSLRQTVSSEHSEDPFVCFQSLDNILHALPTLTLHGPRPQISSLQHLRDFLLQVSIVRAEHAQLESAAHSQTAASSSFGGRTQSKWPSYVRARAMQTFAAVEKRALGLELAAQADTASVQHVMATHCEQLVSQLVSLLHMPTTTPDQNARISVYSHINTALGATGALVDELQAASDGRQNLKERHAKGKRKMEDAEPGSAVGLTHLQHRLCKTAFQTHALPTLMSIILTMLGQNLDRQRQGADSNEVALFPQLVSTLERLLGWSFVIRAPGAGVQSSDGAAADSTELAALLAEDDTEGESAWDSTPDEASRRLFTARRVPHEFAQVLLSADIVHLVTVAYNHAIAAMSVEPSREAATTQHRLRQCMLLVASFSPVHGDASSFHARNSALLSTVQALVQAECATGSDSVTIAGGMVSRGNSLLFLAGFVQIVVLTQPAPLLARTLGVSGTQLGELPHFLGVMSSLAQTIFAFTFLRRRDSDEEDDLIVLGEDMSDAVLGAWHTLVNSVSMCFDRENPHLDGTTELHLLRESVHASVRESIVGPYIEGRLSSAKAALMSGGDVDDGDTEQGEETAKDRDRYADQLLTIAILARLSPAHHLEVLLRRAQPLCEQITAVAKHGWPKTDEQTKELEALWEEMHWLALIAGYVLADEGAGETPMIPTEIVRSQTSTPHPAVLLIHQVGLVMLDSCLSSNGVTSPLLLESLLWFNSRWAGAYLMCENAYSTSTSPALDAALGGQDGLRVLSQLLGLLTSSMTNWISDSDVTNQIASVLASLSRSSGVGKHILAAPDMEVLVDTILSRLDNLASNTHGVVIAGLTACIYNGTVNRDSPERSPEAYFQRITDAIQRRLDQALEQVERPDFAFTLPVQGAAEVALSMLEGLTSSAPPRAARIVLSFATNFLEALVVLATTYAAVPAVHLPVLRVLRALAQALELGFGLEGAEHMHVTAALNSTVSRTLSALATPGALITSSQIEALEDDVPYEGLCLALELLYDLLVSDDNAEPDSETCFSSVPDMTRTADVALFTLVVIARLLTPAPLSIPRVRASLGALCSAIAKRAPRRLLASGLGATAPLQDGHTRNEALALEALPSTLRALTLAIDADDSAVSRDAIDAVEPLTDAAKSLFDLIVTSQAPFAISGAGINNTSSALDQLLGSLLRSLLLSAITTSLIPLLLNSIRHLIICRAHSLLGGADALGTALHSFVIEAISGNTTGVETQSEAMRNERGTLLTETLQQLASLALQPPTGQGAQTTGHIATKMEPTHNLKLAIQTRARQKAEREAYVDAARSLVARARGALRVR